jgi:Na+/proline symporter
MRARYGSATHIVFIVFGLMTNTLVTAMLLTGGSAVVESLTGMSTVAACFFYPLTVVLYTTAGGIKATILTDYMHTAMLIIIIFIFAFTAFATSSTLGSPGRVYDMLVEAGKAHPVEGNAQGSYLTMFSQEGGIFFVIKRVLLAFPR